MAKRNRPSMPGIARRAEVHGGRHDGAQLAVVNPDEAELVLLVESGGNVHVRGKLAHDRRAVLEVLETLVHHLKATAS